MVNFYLGIFILFFLSCSHVPKNYEGGFELKRKKVILDTDIGSDVDDLIALALALASPELEILAVTTTGRQSIYRSQIARKWLALAGHADIPVFTGLDVPLPLKNERNSFIWFDIEGRGSLFDVDRVNAVDEMAKLIKQNENIEIITIGPITNIAALLRKYPNLKGSIRKITAMGGQLAPVNFNGREIDNADYNFRSDPIASMEVLKSEVPIKIVTIDATLKTWFTSEDLNKLSKSNHPFLEAIGKEIEMWRPLQEKFFGYNVEKLDNVAFLHDPLTVVCTYDESFCRVENLRIEPTFTNNKFKTLQSDNLKKGRSVQVVRDADLLKVRTYIIERILKYFKN
ncbi:MAG: nucleoside hydrolase [Halobacteriovoraceae bacterium]|jgi:purine nucleosidase|nr:nucleoside hydrolase [Halobacteriovoraceae bacterium]